MTNTADESPLFGTIRQWQLHERNCPTRGRFFIATGLLTDHATIQDGKIFTVFLPSPVNVSRLRCGDTITCRRSGQNFRLGERRNGNLDSLQSFYLKKSSEEAPRKPAWIPKPRPGQSKRSSTLDVGASYSLEKRFNATNCPQRNDGRRRMSLVETPGRCTGVCETFGKARSGKHDFHSKFCARSRFKSLQKRQGGKCKPVHRVYNRDFGMTAGRPATLAASASE